MTLNEALQQYELEAVGTGKRSLTWKSFARQFVARWGSEASVADVANPSSVRLFIAEERKRGCTPSTINSKLCLLRHVARIAREAGVDARLPENAMLKVDNARTRALTDAEEMRLAAEMSADDYAIVRFFLKQGLRSQEGFNLLVSDCSLETGMMRIRRTKTGGEFFARMHPEVRKMVVKAKKRGQQYLLDSKSVGARRDYERWDYIWKASVFRPALRRAGIKDFKLHDLRHTAASRMANHGVSIAVIGKVLNHRDIKSTMRYCHLETAPVDKALALI